MTRDLVSLLQSSYKKKKKWIVNYNLNSPHFYRYRVNRSREINLDNSLDYNAALLNDYKVFITFF